MLTFARIGADPEFIIARWDGDWTLWPANDAFSVDRAINSFIGTDQHRATGEIRPPAQHNVQRLLYDVATALTYIDNFLVEKKATAYKIVATPYAANEPLGGHIHLSFVTNSLPKNTTIWNGRLYIKDGRTGREGDGTRELVPRHFAGELPTIDALGTALTYMLLPYEAWIQPWTARLNRNRQYGLGGIRLGDSEPPLTVKPEQTYWHLEYRVPSTWLVHPIIAYCYLGLAKLVMLNTHKIIPLAMQDNRDRGALFYDQVPNRQGCKAELDRRGVLLGRTKLTPDLLDLPQAIERSGQIREELLSPGQGVHISAWRKLL